MDRYAGKPFLKFVDLFVLDCIGELDPSHLASLEALTPKLRHAFNSTGGTWQELVMAQLGWKPAIRDAIKTLWEKNQAIAIRDGGAMSPMDFVVEFVKANVKVPGA